MNQLSTSVDAEEHGIDDAAMSADAVSWNASVVRQAWMIHACYSDCTNTWVAEEIY